MSNRVEESVVSPAQQTFLVRKQRSLLCFFTLFSIVLLAFYATGTSQDASRPEIQKLRARSAGATIARRQTAQDLPQKPLLFTDTPATINETVRVFQAAEKSIAEQIIRNVKPDQATFENTVKRYLEHRGAQRVHTASLDIYRSMAPDEALQQAASSVSKSLDEAIQNTHLNEDLSSRFEAVYNKQKDDPNLSEEARKVLRQEWQSFIDSGIKLPAEGRARYAAIARRLDELSAEYNQAISRGETALWFTKEELNGTKPDVLAGLEKGKDGNEGKLKVGLASPAVGAVATQCTNETTRAQIVLAQANRNPENVGRLKEAVQLRDESARLLGFRNFAEYSIKDKMAEHPENVTAFLREIQDKFTPQALKERERLKGIKKDATGNADHLFLWDEGYYIALSAEHEVKLSSDEVKQYFPAEHTVQEIMKLYAHLFGLAFTRIEGQDLDKLSSTGKGRDLIWQDDVQLYSVHNSAEGGSTFVGYLYLDLYFRAGKGPGAYFSGIEPGFLNEDGKTRHYPSGALTTNFEKSKSNEPSLLTLGEVRIILHELGHAMHHLTSVTTYSRTHGPHGGPPDWFEMPSQMMENWAYVPENLKRLSKHWSYLSPESFTEWKKTHTEPQPEETIPDSFIDIILKRRNMWVGGDEVWAVWQSTYDMALHTPARHEDTLKLDTTVLWNQLRANITHSEGFEVLGKGWNWGTGQSASIHHLFGGYEAGLYSYLWSEAYSADVFKTAFEKDPFSAAAGKKFREEILQPGGTKNFKEILKNFLGHEPSNEAFFEALGVKR